MLVCLCLLTGPPGDISDVNISPDTITACSFVVQWSKASSDPVCGSVWYTVTILTEGRMLIITDNTTLTNYNVTGLNDNTVYHVSVTASNNAGSSSNATMSTMTNSNGKSIRLAYKFIKSPFAVALLLCPYMGKFSIGTLCIHIWFLFVIHYCM